MPSRPSGAPAGDLFQALVENSSDAIALVDASGVLLYSSQSAVRLTGFTADERVGQNAFERIHADDLPAVRAAFADALAHPGVTLACEFRVLHKNGSWVDVEALGVNRLAEPSVGGIVINYRDVTARKRAEQALRSSEERLRRLVEHAQDLIYYCDPHGRFTYVNPTAVRVMKYPESELVGRHFLTLIRNDFRQAASEMYARQMADGTPNTYFEFPVLTRDGDTVWLGQHVQLVRAGERVIAVQAIARDITRQKHAEERLRRSEARYRTLIQGAAYGIYLATMDGRILEANPALAAMLGYEHASDLTAVNMRELYADSDDRARLVAQYEREGASMSPVEVPWRHRDGRLIIVRLTARKVDLEDGSSGFEGIAEDVTARRALEDQLRQAQKMEAVGRLARGVAHDFNNLLAAIVGYSDLLIARLAADDPARADAQEISRAAERGASLTRQLLAFSRQQALEPRLFDVSTVAQSLDPILRRLVGDRIALRMRTWPGPLRVRLDPGQVEQVLLNLVVNARDATPEGGTIEIATDEVEVRDPAAFPRAALAPGRYARLVVADTGHGIEERMQRHVFEPFFTTKDAAKGTGLGLSIVYAIVKDAGGAVAFTTRPNPPDRGTTFEVFLPLTQA